VPNRPLFHSLLEEGLALEWEQNLRLIEGKNIVSIYFGGGTPALFPKGIEAVLQKIERPLDCEITVEANPDECSPALFESLLSSGVNRLSIGIQSLDDRSLQTLERTHSAKKGETAILDAHRCGFSNISIDLMYDLPDQTEASWLYTLDRFSSLPIQHLSLYNLTIEPHTSFYKRRNTLSLPDPASSLTFLNAAVNQLEEIGLRRYEISAFARPGRESRHNSGYWTGRPFLGFGPSAFSFWNQERFQNIAHLQRYIRLLREGKSPVDFRERLAPDASKKELLAVSLRLLEGVLFDPSLPSETHEAIERLIAQNLLVHTKNRLRLTERGILFYDTIASELI
jgi:oxygen-independent coproporphyrinogen-3 oxidase